MKQRKPRAYIRKEITGRWGFQLMDAWVARDYWNKEIARGRTVRDCERNCRVNGYVPERW